MRAKYESKYKNFLCLKQFDGVITDTANEMKVSKLKVAEYVEHFLKWQRSAFDEMLSPSYSWKGLGHITASIPAIAKWDELKVKLAEKREQMKKDAASNEADKTN